MLGGKLKLDSQPGKGTRIEVTGRVAQIEGVDLERLLKPLVRLEGLRSNLKRKGIIFEEAVEYARDRRQGSAQVMGYGIEQSLL